MSMNDWINKLEGFLSLNDHDILSHAGKISHDLAISKAEMEYEKFNQMRIAKSDKEGGDFEKVVKLIDGKGKTRGRKKNDRSITELSICNIYMKDENA